MYCTRCTHTRDDVIIKPLQPTTWLEQIERVCLKRRASRTHTASVLYIVTVYRFYTARTNHRRPTDCSRTYTKSNTLCVCVCVFLFGFPSTKARTSGDRRLKRVKKNRGPTGGERATPTTSLTRRRHNNNKYNLLYYLGAYTPLSRHLIRTPDMPATPNNIIYIRECRIIF